MIRAHPIFGIGTNTYGLVMADYVPFFLLQERWIVHNRYLLIWAETGSIGFLSFLFLLAYTFQSLWKSAHSKDSFMSMLSWGLFISFTVLCLQMMVESLYDRVSDANLWLIYGLSVGIGIWIDHHKQTSEK
jgi:O-antigen ligase